ncbi:unnamed protein product, partial [Meganyctiphanes norvegica]
QVEEIIQTLAEHEHSKEKKAGTEFCEEHGFQSLFFCESHDKFICHACCIIEHSKDKCKIIDKNHGLKKIVLACHATIESEKKEFNLFKSKIDTYVNILRKEEDAHLILQNRLLQLASKHEEKRTYLAKERFKVEHFLTDQESSIDIINSLRNTDEVSSIPEASELNDRTTNVINKIKNKRITEEKRCYDLKQLDSSIEARKSTQQKL